MANYSDAISKAKAAGYSDSEIANFLADKEPGIAKARSAGYGDEEIIGHLSSAPAAAPAPAAPQESTASDMLRSADAGIGKGLTTLLGLPGDAASLARAVAPQSVVDKIKAIPGAKFVYDHIPGSEALKATIPTDFSTNYNKDADYAPQTAAGRYTKAVATQAPMMATGMGPLATVGGAVAGQAAYDATGSHLAEAGANLAGSVAAPLALARATRTAMMPLQNAQQLRDVANAHYADPLLRSTRVTPQAVDGLATDMQNALNSGRSAFLPAQAPDVTRGIEALAARATPPAVGPAAPMSIEELHSFRKTLGEMGQEVGNNFRPTEQAAAAGRARRVLDQYLDNIPSHDVASGNPIDAVQSLRDANRNWMAQSGAQRIGNMIGNAEEQAATTGSGYNLGNTIRQKLRPLLMNDAAELRRTGHADLIPAVQEVTHGDAATNTLRGLSNKLGGGGGIAATLIGHGIFGAAGGTAGYEEGGLPGAIMGTALGMLPGKGLRAWANSRTRNAAQAVQDAMLAKAPVNASIVARNNAARLANSQAYSDAAANAIPNTLLQATRVHRIYVGPNRDGNKN